MRKLWLDVETSGLCSEKNGVIQVACLVENEKGKVIDQFELKIKPFKGCVYDKGAEEIHGKSEKEISKYTDEHEAIHSFIEWLEEHQVSRKQFSITGYNSRFDQDFITAWFKRTKKNYWTFFNYYDVDVFALVKILDLGGFINKKYSKKLEAVCNSMGVKLNEAHDALADIKATRKLYKKIVKKYLR